MTASKRLARARVALEGLSVGDGLGSFFEMSTPTRMARIVAERRLLIANAQAATEITHLHPEGIAGGVAAALAHQHRAAPDMRAQDWLAAVIAHLPESEVRRKCLLAAALPLDTSLMQAVEQLGNGADVSAQDTVPLALWCAARQRHNYEAALWLVMGAGGDVDTTGAIVGGIVALSVGVAGIPAAWLAQREPLPTWALG
jgi:ADP-ribosylglycohydrolase